MLARPELILICLILVALASMRRQTLVSIWLLVLVASVGPLEAAFADGGDWRAKAQGQAAQARWKTFTDAGNWFLARGEDDQALTYYQEALRAAREAFTMDDERLADALIRVGELELEPDIARDALSEALGIQRRALGSQHPAVARTLESIVWTFDHDGGNAEVVSALMREAVAIWRASNEPIELARALRVLAWVYEANGHPGDAGPLYEEALSLEIATLGDADIRVILARENLAEFYLDQERFEDAQAVLERKRDAHLRMPVVDFYNLSRTESRLGWTHLRQGDRVAAERYYQQALAHLNDAIGPRDSTLHVPLLLDLVYLHASIGDFEAASPYFHRAQQIMLDAGWQPPGQGGVISLSSNDEGLSGPARAQADAVRMMLNYAGLELDD